jgi:hypothetical protein
MANHTVAVPATAKQPRVKRGAKRQDGQGPV